MKKQSLLTRACALQFVAVFVSALTAVTVAAETTPEKTADTPAERVEFSRDILPILSTSCFKCHGPDAKQRKADLRLDVRENAIAGNPGDAAIVPGHSADSQLIARVTSTDTDERMPPKGEPLSAEKISLLRRWIEQGADYSEHWAFVPPRRPPTPTVANAEWSRSPIDAFVFQRLEEQHMQPAPAATRAALIRRASLDLIGLPPTPEEIKQFVADSSPDAYERLVDRLLQSPHYGERWGRHWLDVARYADSGGFETDLFFGHAWRYRDYVIRAFNADKPYNDFIREQVAADELNPDNKEGLIATGFYTTGPVLQEAGMVTGKLEYDQLTDAVDTTGSAFLGMTLGCARCHDHKYDPISQREYYGMQAIFAPSDQYDLKADWSILRGRAALKSTLKEFESAQARARTRRGAVAATKSAATKADVAVVKPAPSSADVAATKPAATNAEVATAKPAPSSTDVAVAKPAATKPDADAVAAVAAADEEEEKEEYAELPTRVMAHREKPVEVHLLKRGELDDPGDLVDAGLPKKLAGDHPFADVPTDKRRAELANWLASEKNPLTARVIVNRAWQWHFGQGLVRTPNDFGVRGEHPTHPELLDWLAVEFMEHGWSLKYLNRLIMLSSAYQMSAAADRETVDRDPDNLWLARYQPRRLEAEAIWDSFRAAAGTLDSTMYGLPFAPPLDEQEQIGNFRKWPTSTPEESNRRAVYILVKRSFRFPTLSAFDLPDNISSCGQRDITTVPNQALTLLNNRMVKEQAALFAGRLLRETDGTPTAVAGLAWNYAYGRDISEDERHKVIEFIQARSEGSAGDGGDAIKLAVEELCLALFNTNEFTYTP